MLKKIIHPLLLSFVLASCNSQSSGQTDHKMLSPIVIHRFDKALFETLEANNMEKQMTFQYKNSPMLDLLSKGLFNVPLSDSVDIFTKLGNYYGEPNLHGLYKEAVAQYTLVTDIEKDLTTGFSYLHQNFPNMQIPAVYMHISGFKQNVLVGDSILSLSIDKYMGSNYPLYKDFFYEPQRRKMQRVYAAPDYMGGWLMSEYPFNGNEQVLLDKMIYEGKIKYILSQALPELKPELLLAYTEKEYEWCKKNEESLWKMIIEKGQLYTPDLLTTARYFEDTPAGKFLAAEAPTNIGTWIGWQIVNEYMKKSGSTPQQLMQATNVQEILRLAEYKP